MGRVLFLKVQIPSTCSLNPHPHHCQPYLACLTYHSCPVFVPPGTGSGGWDNWKRSGMTFTAFRACSRPFQNTWFPYFDCEETSLTCLNLKFVRCPNCQLQSPCVSAQSLSSDTQVIFFPASHLLASPSLSYLQTAPTLSADRIQSKNNPFIFCPTNVRAWLVTLINLFLKDVGFYKIT